MGVIGSPRRNILFVYINCDVIEFLVALVLIRSAAMHFNCLRQLWEVFIQSVVRVNCSSQRFSIMFRSRDFAGPLKVRIAWQRDGQSQLRPNELSCGTILWKDKGATFYALAKGIKVYSNRYERNASDTSWAFVEHSWWCRPWFRKFFVCR